MMQTDVSAGVAAAAASTTITSSRARIKAIILAFTSAAGTITITDGNGSGVTLFSFTPGATPGSLYIPLPGEGILARNGIYVTNGTGTSATIVYG